MTQLNLTKTQNRIAFHTLQITHPDQSLDFYQNRLGMTLFSEQKQTTNRGVNHRFFLGFQSEDNQQNGTHLELSYQEGQLAKIDHPDPNGKDGYWKIGITLEDVDLGREQLLSASISVSEPHQFRDIGYLCHLADPDGHSIELLQHRFEQNHTRLAPQPDYKLMSRPTFGQITLRVKDAEQSLRFYQEGLGMRLLSRQVVEPYQFTLYFLAYSDDKLPFDDIDHVGNREWLWQRPYTTLELQHVWDTEADTFAYRTGPETGFLGMGFSLKNKNQVFKNCADLAVTVEESVLSDPDQYQIRLIDAEN